MDDKAVSAAASKPSVPTFRLDGRTALVTGGSAGIGEGIALALGSAGADVILLARRRGVLEDAGKRMKEAGYAQPRLLSIDVLDTEAIQRAIADLPRLDILVNNAGTNIPEPFLSVSIANLDTICNLNVRAYFIVAQAATRKMLEDDQRVKKGGCIINISSQMGHVGSPDRSVYCMSKHAVEGLTKALAVELAPKNIRVNSIAPTFVETPLVRRIVDTPEKRELLVSKIPMGHMAQVADIAGAAIFLASPAASMVTGMCLRVDGGWVAQ